MLLSHFQHVCDFTEGFRVNHAGAGARVGGPGVRGAGVEGAQAPPLRSNAAAPDNLKGSPSAHALAKSSDTKGMQFCCETLCLLRCVQHFKLAICTCWQQCYQSCAGSSCTSCMRSWFRNQHINHSVCQCACFCLSCFMAVRWPLLECIHLPRHLTWSLSHQDTSVLMSTWVLSSVGDCV